MKKFNLKTKKDIIKFGLAKYIDECKKFAMDSMHAMSKDFIRLGVWMDFENAYRPITPESIEAIWWLIKKVHGQERLYEGLRTMTWCAGCETALAKHELVYKEVKDNSIYLKFKVKGKNNEYLIVWTTTPWTIPFNLGVMANPDVDYVKAKVDSEYWIIAKDLADSLISKLLDKKVQIVDEFKGKKLEGLEYTPALYAELRHIYDDIKNKAKKTHTVLLSSEYVDTSAGTGLVHTAPGCGPEDYEVGHRNNIPPFNNLSEQGIFPEDMKTFAGFAAKKDDSKFIEHFKKNGTLVAETKLEHDYAHCWRCHNPVIYRATKQWFFKIEDLKEKMVKENNGIKWIPKASFNAFDSWLRHLRDNSITKQRYWGTPLPVWRCDSCNKFEVLASREEIKKVAGKEPERLHKPWIDEVTYKCKCNGTMKRIPDVMDVWIDPGSASWICLNYPQQTELFKKLFPADFILEGIDQYRGWFNVLIVCSVLAFKKTSFKACYVHGFINDAQGRKMSKSLGNYILPGEVIDKYGSDTFRFYSIAGADPALDLNYNFDDMKVKYRNLAVLWNIHNFLIDLADNIGINPQNLKISEEDISIEEKYIFSKLNSTIMVATELFDEYRLNEVPILAEELFLKLSRTYIQLTRDKVYGKGNERKVVLYTAYHVLIETLKLFATVAPFITEKIYQNLRKQFSLHAESIHLLEWPKLDEKSIDKNLELEMDSVSNIVQVILSLREKIQLGTRWPLQEAIIVTKDEKIVKAVESLKEIIKKQANIKEIDIQRSLPEIKVKIKADYSQIGPSFGNKAPTIIAKLTSESPETVLSHIEKQGKHEIRVDKEKFNIVKEHLIVTREIPNRYIEGTFKNGFVYLNKQVDDELEAEGFARELMRRVQELRKKSGLQKKDSVSLFIKTDDEMKEMLSLFSGTIKEKVGAKTFKISNLEPSKEHEFTSKEKVKDRKFEVFLEKV
jgi:isoleucyl-tRNA synthetase